MSLMIIDGNNIAYRVFHTPQSSLTTKDGTPSGIIIGVLNMVKGYLEKFPETTKVVICWDGGKAAWRKELYPDYKANRSYGESEEEKARFKALYEQIDTLHSFLPSIGVHSLKFKGWEADDLMYAITKLEPRESLVVTSDKDMFQLVDEKVSIYNLYKDVIISHLNFFEQMGVTREQYMGYRALVGDVSDKIPGVDGIGEKTAKNLMSTYGHIDNVLNATGDALKALKKSKRTAKIFEEDNLKILGRNHRIMNFKYVDYSEVQEEILTTLGTPIQVNNKAVKDFFIKWQFASILANYISWVSPYLALGEDVYESSNRP